MPFNQKPQKFNAKINSVTIGNGDKTVTIGGENSFPFYSFDAPTENAPKIGVEISDLGLDEFSEGVKAYYEGATTMADIAKKAAAIEGADFVALILDGGDPNGANKSVEELIGVVKEVADAIDCPLVVEGCKNVEKDAELLPKVAEVLQGRNALLLSEKNKALLEKQDYEIYAATLRERNRIAREIHDNVGHVLSRSILMTAACKTINKNEALDPLLGNLEESLNGAMNSIRSSVHDLHDDAVNLEDAIKGLVKDFSFCPVTLTYDMSRQVPREVKYSLISITKEGLSNVMRHSNADSVNILLREHPALYQLCIEDNGTLGSKIPDIQTDADSNKMETVSGGMGLSNIRDRVKALGGTVQITQEKGFRICVTIPKSGSN